MASGGGTGLFGLQPQDVASGDNDMTRYQRSVTNLLGQSGAQTQAKGNTLTDTGTKELQPAIDYWSGILSGNKADIAAAASPELSATTAQFKNQRRVLDQYTPMGGGRSQSLASSRTAEAQTKSDIISKTRSGAAPQLAGAAQQQEALGLQQQSLGIEQLGQAIQAILQKMGLNIQGGTSNTFSSILQGIGSII